MVVQENLLDGKLLVSSDEVVGRSMDRNDHDV